jgi:Uma2 family endonuclease
MTAPALPPASPSAKLLTWQEFAALPEPKDGSRQELVKGVVITMAPPGFRHGTVQLNAGVLIRSFLKTHDMGRVATETGVITERAPDSVRGPDAAYWSYERLPKVQVPEVYPELAADLCVEVLSPSNTPKHMLSKLEEYFASGVRMVWVLDPETKSMYVYRNATEGRILTENAQLTGEDVLPGFECKVSEFFV